MSLRLRYTFLIILIILFLIVAPVVILYTAGYRYNFVKNKIEKTGILVIDSEPDNALVFINEKGQKHKTKARIKNLLPDTYLVRLEKDGYYVWEKFLEVKSKFTTFAENIVLFKKSIPMQVVSGKISNISLSRDKKTLAYISNNTLKILNLRDKTETEIYKNAAQIIKITWSADDKKILVEEKYYPHFKIIDVVGENEIFIPKNHFGINFKELRWDENNGNILHGLKLVSLKSGTLYQIDLENKKTSIPIPVGNAFIVRGDTIYSTESNNNNDFLFKRSFSEPADAEQITMLPVGNYEFLDFKEDYVTLLHKDRGELVFINLENSDENNILEVEVVDSEWTDEGTDKLLIKKDFEILVYNFETEKKELITRYGEEIEKALWHPGGGYLFFSMNENIQVIELDSRGGARNKITLVNFDEVDNFFLNDDAEKIYFSGKVGSQEGIYELEIQ